MKKINRGRLEGLLSEQGKEGIYEYTAQAEPVSAANEEQAKKAGASAGRVCDGRAAQAGVPQEDAERVGLFRRLFTRKKAAGVSPLAYGATGVADILAPASVNLQHKDYIIVDGVYHAYLYIAGYGYPSTVGNGWLIPFVEAGEGVNLSFTLRRQPKDKTLSKIAQATMINRSRMRDVGDTRADFEELDSAVASGLYLKDSMNRYSEDFYYMHTLIEITADDPETLERRVSHVKKKCASRDVVCRRADYMHEQAFLAALPLLGPDPDIERKTRRNVLSTAAAAAFPFSSFEICEQDGIFLGVNGHNSSVCILDLFNSRKYSNSNLTAVGMSGAGKTFFLQLLAMRIREQGTQVFIIAPLKGYEYRAACEAVGGRYIKLGPSSPDCINILEIRRTSLDIDAELGSLRNDSLLYDKIQKVLIFFRLLSPSMTDEDEQLLDSALIDCYGRFGITADNGSLLGENGEIRPMPTLKDLHGVLDEKRETKRLALALARYVTGSSRSLGGHTNVDLGNKYVVLDISDMSKDLPMGMFLALDYCWDKCKESRVRKKALILDELWCLIGASSNRLAADFVLEIFKIARGLGVAAIAATQDLNDFFALDDGKYGRAVLNNSRLKVVLPLEEDEAMRVQQLLGLSDEETVSVIKNEKGVCLLCAGRSRITVGISASEAEHELISTDRGELARRLGVKQMKKLE